MHILSEVKHNLTQCNVPHSAQLNQIFENIEDPFSSLSTQKLQHSYLRNNFEYVEPLEINLGTYIARKKKNNKIIITEKNDTFMYIPIIDSLKQWLGNKDISKCSIKPPTIVEDGVYYDICDGSIYQTDQYFKDNPEALILVLYHDEVEICNPLGSHATIHKLDQYYYTIANLEPQYRSKHAAVRLLSVVNAKLVKKYGVEQILRPALKDLDILYNGVDMEINGEVKTVKAKV